ncbi:MAG TPA: trypsin-like peptidase domain-containing protein [Puia sp.]|uniref:S1C family serine protease n=1 Tax=Puia sp. TaxID=2045100 RepID=UPI002C710836|nr:trypsin-like peptidase domain-containing protein [Puia sp.]HVU94180.1 trypsin-like peptidase domain-containing protein [Puia sp.]
MKKLYALALLLAALSLSAFGQDDARVIPTSAAKTRSFGPTLSFRYAAGRATPCVTHITALFQQQMSAEDRNVLTELFGEKFFREFFAPLDSQLNVREVSASGVIISPNGYIVTNCHAVDKARSIAVFLTDQRSYRGEIIATDSFSDLALLHIDEYGLPTIEFGDSDSTEVGDWVLAVGNPLDLASTVTSGIISARYRSLDSKGDSNSLDCYLQTDAVANPGNSGGALVDLEGRLIGITSAIETPNGVFAGYSFAIPANIVKKVVNDLYRYGQLRRGYLGIVVSTMNDAKAQDLRLALRAGICIDRIDPHGGAASAGLQTGDVIVRINDDPVASTTRFRELMARYRPGDKVLVAFLRYGREFRLIIPLRARSNTGDVIHGWQ